MSGPDAEPVVVVDHLTKRFTGDLRRSLRYALQDIGRELVARRSRNGARPGEYAALDDVSFELRPGEALAVLGRNGAGKSTLLKILYGLIKPDGGEVRLRGRVSGLIELGTGFDPVLTGRENIAVNAAIMGLPTSELRSMTEEVLAFAELSDAAETPLRYYSSGMTARLAFAVAAHLRPDVLLVDEVLAVGDFEFQRKCFKHLAGFLADGGSLVLVSHNVFLVQTLCSRGMVLDRGSCVYAGTAVDAVARYLAAREAEPARANGSRPAPGSFGPLVIEDVTAAGPEGGPPETGEPMTVTLRYRSSEPLAACWGFSIFTGDDWVCVTGDYETTPRRLDREGTLTATVPALPLVGGTYTLRAAVHEADTLQPLALHGYFDVPPLLLRVRTPAGFVENTLRATNQLMTLDVDWH